MAFIVKSFVRIDANVYTDVSIPIGLKLCLTE